MPSKAEMELGRLLSSEFPNLKIKSQVILRKGDLRLYVDYTVPSLKLAFEVDGRQHSQFVPHFHKTQSLFNRSKINDGYKQEILDEMGYKLIRFNFDEDITKINLRKKINE